MKKNNLKINYVFFIFILILILIDLPISKVYAKYEISKSKEATNLDENYESEITISTPINDGNNFYDFVFVLDKSTSGNNDIIQAIDDFYEKLDNSYKNIKVGVVAFYNKAEIIKSFTDTKIGTVSGSGTNLSAGILLGTQMLDEDIIVPSSHKYLVLISDGDTHVFNKNNTLDGEPTAIAQGNDSSNTSKIAGPDSYKNKYSNFDPPSDWQLYFEEIAKQIENDGDLYENPYNTKGNNKYNDTDKYIPYDEISEHAVSVDKALYYSYINYLAAQEKGYKTFTVPIESSSGRSYGTSFMKFLNNGNEISIDSLIDITYMVGPGTTIVDYIGNGTDNQGSDYNFDVVDDINNYSVKIDGVLTDITKITTSESATSTYGAASNNDGTYKYIINYYEGNNERVEIVYNVIVTNISPIEITFKVKLMNPSTISGNHTGLNTNNDCIIKIVDSKGNLVGEENFEKPILNYTIKQNENNNENDIPNDNTTVSDTNNNENINTTDVNNTVNISNIFTKQNPNTGNHIEIYMFIFILAILALVTILISKKRKKFQNKK